MNGELKIENGQFIKDGQVVKPEFGNWDQILALKKAVCFEGEIENPEVETSVPVVFETTEEEVIHYDYTTNITFKCLCGKKIEEYHSEDTENYEWTDANNVSSNCENDFEEEYDITCTACRRVWIVKKKDDEVKAFLQK